MRQILLLILISAVAFTGCGSHTEEQASDMPILKGPYLGMKPPGDVPELFAPGIVSSVYLEHSSAVFTPDGNELFWSREINLGRTPRIIVIMHMIQERGVWSRPELAPFNFNDALYNHINSVSPDGKRLYFFTEHDNQNHKAWVVDKTDNGWGEPRRIRLNTIDHPGSKVSEVHETRSGNLYCTGPCAAMPQGWGIVRSRFVDGKYQAYESLGPHVNFPVDDSFPNYHPTVDPDERFVIFVSRRPGGYGTQDLYISYRRPDETFGPAINLGPKINTVGMGNSWPQLSPDGKYLFFWSNSQPFDEKDLLENKYSYAELMEIRESHRNGRGNIFWVNTSFVETLKPSGIE
jgi:hypothetical protein